MKEYEDFVVCDRKPLYVILCDDSFQVIVCLSPFDFVNDIP